MLDYLCVGGVFIDDIVFPNGETCMEVLGGGSVHCGAGMRVWDERPGLAGCAGRDLPQRALERLERDFDLRGLIRLDIPQVRAWQLFEWDGRRTEVFRVDEIAPYLDRPLPEETAAVYSKVGAMSLLRDAADVASWRQHYPDTVLLWEPEQAFMTARNREAFIAALPLVDIVSPNLLEASLVYGFDDPERLVRQMLADGAKVVALRMGEAGSLVGVREMDALVRTPPVPVAQIVDQTGAGNSYCGGFLVGWRRSGDPFIAACYGAVSASFTLEVTGVLDTSREDLHEQRDQRLAWVKSHTHRV